MLVVPIYSLQCDTPPHATRCGCSFDGSKFRLICPAGLYTAVQGRKVRVNWSHQRPVNKLEVICDQGTSMEQLMKYLKTIDLEGDMVEEMRVNQCPASPMSIDKIIESVNGTTNLKWLEIINITMENDIPRNQMQDVFIHLLSSLGSLTSLSIIHHKYLNIFKDTFKQLKYLQTLTIRDNDQIVIEKSAFSHLTNLKSLDLKRIRVMNLQQNIFKGLRSLTHLDLQSNDIKSLPRDIFYSLPKLEELDLHSNNLVDLPQDIFRKSYHLKEINLDCNKFVSLPKNMFKSTKHIRELVIDNSFCEESSTLHPPGSMISSPSIRKVKIRFIKLARLPSHWLLGCDNIRDIIIQNSQLKQLPEDLFHYSNQVENINFDYNYIKKLPQNIFKGLKNLKDMSLKHNLLVRIEKPMFNGLQLRSLDLSHNKIKEINLLHTHNSVVNVDLSYNKLTTSEFGEYGTFDRLEMLNLSHNKIENIYHGIWIAYLSLKHLILHNNLFSGSIKLEKAKSMNLDLSFNSIENIVMKKKIFSPSGKFIANISYHPKEVFSQFEKLIVNISSNPIQCDCHATDLKEKIVDNSKQQEWGAFFEEFTCSTNQSILNIEYEELNCALKSMPGYTSMDCPDTCTCSYNKYFKTVIVDCSNQNLTEIPKRFPKTKETINKMFVNLSHNHLGPELRDYIQKIHNYDSFTSFDLSFNELQSFPITFIPKKVELVRLNNNGIQHLPDVILRNFEEMSNVTKFYLGNNPFACDCSSRQLFYFVKYNTSAIHDHQHIRLNCGPSDQLLLGQAEIQDFCIPYDQHMMLTLVCSVTFFIITIIMATLLYCHHKQTLTIWLYNQHWARATIFMSSKRDLLDFEKEFDAFLSYSHHDREWVEEVLYPGLTSPEDPKKPSFDICIHTVHWQVGKSS